MLIDIVFDGPPGPKPGNFVEVENVRGESINAGEWIDRGDGMWALRLEAVGNGQVHAISIPVQGKVRERLVEQLRDLPGDTQVKLSHPSGDVIDRPVLCDVSELCVGLAALAHSEAPKGESVRDLMRHAAVLVAMFDGKKSPNQELVDALNGMEDALEALADDAPATCSCNTGCDDCEENPDA